MQRRECAVWSDLDTIRTMSGCVRSRIANEAIPRSMEPLSAVTTTGIYCRPDCSARPHPRNVRPFDSAAAAEAAGFRACMRCRPYRSDRPERWDGPELVCRAVRLVVTGALDDATEEQLGRRLGVSARHLRRLFAEHVGATPDQLARSRRAHFARRLLDDTDLTVTEVAFASGFGSVRQLNRACQEVFRAPPRELRARRRRTDRLVADGGLALRLPFTGPLAVDDLFDWMRARAIPGVEHVDGHTYRRTIEVEGHPGVLEVLPGDSASDDHLRLVAHLPHWEGLIHVVGRARRLFALDTPVEDAVTGLRGDAVLGPVVTAQPGLRPPGTWDPFEACVRAVVGQQISVAGARTILGRLAARLGQPVGGLDAMGLDRLFPSPTAIAEGDLDGLGLTTARARTLRELAAAVLDGTVVLDGSVGLDELVASLTALRGVGPWTAQYVALRLGEPDAMPVGDLGLRKGLAALAPDADLATVAPRWVPWRAFAAMHLWSATPPPR